VGRIAALISEAKRRTTLAGVHLEIWLWMDVEKIDAFNSMNVRFAYLCG